MMLKRPAEMINGLLLLLVGCASIQGATFKQNLPVEINPDRQVAVKLGQRQTILCNLGVALQVCRFSIPGEGSLVFIGNQGSEDGIEYAGEGLDKGHCGITIASVKETHDGNITCFLTPKNGRTENSNTVRMVVAKPPLEPRLYLNTYGAYRTGEKMEVSCVAEGGRPPANVSLYLDNEPIGVEDRTMMYLRPSDENLAIVNTSRSVSPIDHGKTLRCIAEHIALDRPMETSKQIEVYFPPQPKEAINSFGYSIGRNGIVNVTVHANPMPTFTWIIDDVKIQPREQDPTGRFQTSSPQDLGRGYWSLVLMIDSVQKSDTDKDYSLRAENSEGEATYKIHLSSSSEPPAGVDLDAGSIIGIVVGVLVLILAVFLVIFARATGRWCFAGTSGKRNIAETSETESTGRYSRSEVDAGKTGRPKISLSQLFKRNKDKVSGADTDTVRTVVTMDDEKIPTSEAGQEARKDGHEGGIVYAELDLAHQQQPPRRINDEKTEYAEILYTKPDGQPQERPAANQ